MSSHAERAPGRIARVIPDVAGIDNEFDYAIPERFDALVGIGTIVRVDLHGRRVRGWVVDDNSIPPSGVRLLDIQKVSGSGPPRELIDLAGWAAWRWAGKRSFFLQTASPQRNVPPLRSPDEVRAFEADTGPQERAPLNGNEIVRIPPARSPLEEVLASGNGTLLITPTQRSAEGWARRLRAEGFKVAMYPDEWQFAAEGRADYVVGTRSAAWAPMPNMAGAVVVDAHDQGLQSEASPTWNAADVVTERARRRDVDVHLVSSVPRVEQLAGRTLRTIDRVDERAGWAPLVVVDRQGSDPHTGMYSPELVEALRSEKRVLCILNRKGRAQLMVCAQCQAIAKCEQCSGALSLEGDQLKCSRCGSSQPVVCAECGSGRFKQLRQGIQRVREDLESLALRPVAEVEGETDGIPDAQVIVGTEAALQRVPHADYVVFLDFDQELLAPRYRATEDALVLLARASRIVGGHDRGVVIVQTRMPEHDVIQAATYGDPDRFTRREVERRKEMNWPPNSAVARISGTSAQSFVQQLENVEAFSMEKNIWLVQAQSHEVLCDALSKARRSGGNTLRVEVDPPRV